MLYVKPQLSARQLAAELLGSQLGSCLGLPCPPPFLVSVAPHHVGGSRGSAILTFGSQQAGGSRTVFPVKNLAMISEMLKKTKHAEATCILDEWIANGVRGPGDMLFDTQKQVWLFDHEGAFEQTVRPNQPARNWIATELLLGMTRSQRSDFLSRLSARLEPVMRMRLGRMPPELNQVDRGPEAYRSLLEFLEERRDHLGSLLSARVMPEQMTFENFGQPSDDDERANER